MALDPERWIYPTLSGLYVEPADAFIDPPRAVSRAFITHGHSDHARAGHGAVLATPETVAIMALRLGSEGAGRFEPIPYGETRRIGAVDVRYVPAGHVLGSAQIVLEYEGSRVVVSGDYKRRPDPTCPAFEPVPCDVFVTEATFGLPVFRHPDDAGEIARLLASQALFAERTHVVGVYSLGKAQRVMTLLRRAGYDAPIPIHGALAAMSELYERFGVDLGPLEPATGMLPRDLKGKIVLAPPGGLATAWLRRLPDPLIAMASGWMRVKQRAKQSGVELPLVISDHADWDELTRTLTEVAAGEVWVTHGNEEALIRQAGLLGMTARALSLVGYGDEEAA